MSEMPTRRTPPARLVRPWPGVPDVPPPALDETALRRLLSLQVGVVAREQLVALGARPHDLERLLRRRLVVVVPGVYVDHTGELTWVQRAWVAVLACWPAALCGASALRAEAGPGWKGHADSAPIEVAVALGRTLRPGRGIRPRRLAGLEGRVRWNSSPPRVRAEEATLDVALAAPDEWAMVERLARSCRARLTTAERLVEAVGSRARVRDRARVLEVLADIGAGTASVLEQVYLERVERAHGLPVGDRQLVERTLQGRVYRDVRYASYTFLVELDGKLWHDDPEQRDRDLERDLVAAVDEDLTVRLGWGQACRRPCRTAWAVARILRSRGWDGEPVRCGPDCGLEW